MATYADTEQTVRARFTVHGRVQGVGYRRYVEKQVAALGGLSGWVMNASDGTVVGEVQGARADVRRLEELLLVGPTHSSVASVDYDYVPAVAGDGSFKIRR
ncbi:acylphosphatase [Dipodascopsis tothii]|uniref:acylphosphatase n=1 Tax=Dipodascopsis tothii TaxID=44089 RepID=UPI0034CD23B9